MDLTGQLIASRNALKKIFAAVFFLNPSFYVTFPFLGIIQSLIT